MFLPLLFSLAFAQTANIKDIPADGDTTISVTKGSNKGAGYQITEGTADISGDPEVLTKVARTSWKKACEDWKKETKELNSDNKVLVLNCNSPKCEKNQASETVCQSTGSYKVRVKIKD